MDTTSSEHPPDAEPSFTLFSLLPPELRERIWRTSAFPRIVHLKKARSKTNKCSRVWSQTSIEEPEMMGFFDLDNQPRTARNLGGPVSPWGFKSNSIPPLLLACKESNALARQIYTLSFESPEMSPTTWFNFETDILYLDWNFDFSASYEDESVHDTSECFDYHPEDIAGRSKVKNLAIFIPDCLIYRAWLVDYVLEEFCNVQSFKLVYPAHRFWDCDQSDLVFLEWDEVAELQKWVPYSQNFTERRTAGLLNPRFTLSYRWTFNYYCWRSIEEINEGYSDPSFRSDQRRLPRFRELYLQCKPVVPREIKLRILEELQEYEDDRSSKLEITLTSDNHKPIVVSATLQTTFLDLILKFCQAKGTDIEVKNGKVPVDLYEDGKDLISQTNNTLYMYYEGGRWRSLKTMRKMLFNLVFRKTEQRQHDSHGQI
ncbi:hypothetical protein HYFRA_00000372 [Hymenoscyphus fraxineus]|uniref:2EXR domain-containing protein n=1 Tax=Hymenoscyphus fraxineus TaxID=746836 RepID=A0A9N9PWP9_9HELO|nr:hypothetical protein HYFRA_00000372 [Hymenoscyphus fraxineus]